MAKNKAKKKSYRPSVSKFWTSHFLRNYKIHLWKELWDKGRKCRSIIMVNKRYESAGTYRGRCHESPLCGVAQNSSYFLHFSRCQRLRETSAHRRQPLFLMAEMYLLGFSCKRSDSPVLICSDWNLLVWRLSRCWDGGDRAWPSAISFMCLPLQGLLHPTHTSTSASCRESLFPPISTVFYKDFYSLFQLSPRVYFITLFFFF